MLVCSKFTFFLIVVLLYCIIDKSVTVGNPTNISSKVEDSTTTVCPENDDCNSTFFEWINTKNPKDFRALHADYIQKHRNTTISPCENFYQYACGNPANPEKGLNKLLIQFLSSDIQKDDSEVVTKVKKFYKSCMNVEEINARKTKPLMEFMMDLGSWPVFNPEWSGDNFSWESMIAKARLHIIHIFIRQFISHKITNQTEDMYNMDLISDDFPPPEEFEKGMEMFKEFLTNSSIDTEQNGINIHYVEDMIPRITEFNRKLFEIPCSGGDLQVINFRTLRENVPQIEWQDYFSVLLGRPMYPREIVMIYDLKYLVTLAELIAETDPKTVADYIFIQILGRLSQYVRVWPNSDRSDYCYRRSNEFMGPVLKNYININYFNTYKKNEVLSLVEDMRKVLEKAIESNKWLQEESKDEAIKKLNRIDIIVATNNFYSEKDLKYIYSDIHVNANEFFENSVQFDRLRVRLRHHLMGRTLDEMDEFGSKSRIILSPSELLPPVYHEFAPRFINYASIGHTFGDSMLTALDLRHIDEGHRNNNTEEDQQGFDQHNACFINQTNSEIDSWETFTRLIDTEALKMAFGAYKNWTENHADMVESELKDYDRLDLTSSQLFYLIYAQNHCIDKYGRDNSEERMSHVNDVISNNEEFAKAFNCPTGAPMNPEEKCTFIF